MKKPLLLRDVFSCLCNQKETLAEPLDHHHHFLGIDLQMHWWLGRKRDGDPLAVLAQREAQARHRSLPNVPDRCNAYDGGDGKSRVGEVLGKCGPRVLD